MCIVYTFFSCNWQILNILYIEFVKSSYKNLIDMMHYDITYSYIVVYLLTVVFGIAPNNPLNVSAPGKPQNFL